MKKKLILCAVASALILCSCDISDISTTTTNSVSEKEAETTIITETTTAETEADDAIKLNSGELLDITESESTVIVKAKINSLMSNEQTVKQNYHNVADLICNHGFDKYDEIQYWAVSDTRDGEEIKVISFTLDKELINKTASQELLPINYQDNVLDLWILPSLMD